MGSIPQDVRRGGLTGIINDCTEVFYNSISSNSEANQALSR
jgi:hypothetical protein